MCAQVCVRVCVCMSVLVRRCVCACEYSTAIVSVCSESEARSHRAVRELKCLSVLPSRGSGGVSEHS